MATTDSVSAVAKQLRQKEAWLRAILDAAAELSALSRAGRSQENPVPEVGTLLWQENLCEAQRDHVDIFKRAVMNLVSLENELIDLSSFECGDFRLEVVDFDLKQVIDQTFDRLKQGGRSQRLLLRSMLAPALRRKFAGDPVRFQCVLGNLLEKAVRQTKAGVITLAVRTDHHNPNHLRLEILSQRAASGDDLDELHRAGDRSERSPHSEPDIAQLRLDFCKQLVGAMGGELIFGSEADQSAFCEFDVVFEAASESEPALAASNGKWSNTEAPQGPAIRVLIAEDSADTRFLLKVFLKGDLYRITFAENGQLAVEAALAQCFDLILMDIQMPVMDGLTATRLIRQAEKDLGRKATPLLALTGNSRKSDIDLSMAAGCDEHILKPISKSALLKTIHKYVTPNLHNDESEAVETSDSFFMAQPKTAVCANL